MKPQRVIAGTPFLDQNYSAVTLNWLQLRPQPERWLGTLGAYIPDAHNALVREFLATDADRLLILECDMAVHAGLIARCRTHRADVVTGAYVERRPPYRPLVYPSVDPTGTAHNIQPDEVARIIDEGQGREMPIAAAGTGIISIHRRVLEKLSDPWFEASPVALEQRENAGHDLYFWAKAREAGFTTAWDTSEIMYAYHIGWQQYTLIDFVQRVQKEAMILNGPA